MAGSFGYEAEHYAASKAMAELSLLPAVRAGRRKATSWSPTAPVAGIRFMTARAAEAMHVARVLALALDPGSTS